MDQLRLLTDQKLMGKTLMKEDVNYSSNNGTDQQKPVTNNEELLVKATKEVKLK